MQLALLPSRFTWGRSLNLGALGSVHGPQRFTATLEERWFVVPVDARELWGEARPPVSGTINGHPFRGRLAVYGGETVLGLTNAYRAEVGIVPGDRIEVVMDRDDAPREVEVPPALQAVLDGDKVARAAYEKLSFTHRREYAQWIAEAKREETRSGGPPARARCSARARRRRVRRSGAAGWRRRGRARRPANSTITTGVDLALEAPIASTGAYVRHAAVSPRSTDSPATRIAGAKGFGEDMRAVSRSGFQTCGWVTRVRPAAVLARRHPEFRTDPAGGFLKGLAL